MKDQVFSLCRAGGGGEMEWNFLNPQGDGKKEAQACSPEPGMLELQAPLDASEVSLGQIKGSMLHPAGEDTDGTHYPKMWSQ